MSDKNIDNRRITFLLAYGDEGRVDVMFSPEKTYYRIDFSDTLEDGELPGLHEQYDSFKEDLQSAFNGEPEEITPVRFKLFVNNITATPKTLNYASLQRFVDILVAKYDEMSVLYQLIN